MRRRYRDRADGGAGLDGGVRGARSTGAAGMRFLPVAMILAGLCGLCGPGVAGAQATARLSCGAFGNLTLTDQFTTLTYGNGKSTRRLPVSAVATQPPGAAGVASGVAPTQPGVSTPAANVAVSQGRQPAAMRFADGVVLQAQVTGAMHYTLDLADGTRHRCVKR